MKDKVKKILHNINRRDINFSPKVSKYSKLLLTFFLLISFVFVAKNILAAKNIPTETTDGFKDKQSALNEGDNQESWMNESAGSNGMVGVNVLAGDVPDDALDGDGTTTWIPGGLIGLTNRSIASLYDIPVSGVEYIAHVKDNFLGKPVHAANNGFTSLSPLIPIWKGFRNATYILFSLVFVVIGLMIMLRIKVSPQATLTIQNSIPKLITSLVLVTFSYAIVGLLIDFTYVIAGLGISIILNSTNNGANVIDIVANPGVMGRIFEITPVWIGAVLGGVVGGIMALIPAIGWVMGIIAFILIFLGTLIFIFVQVFKFFIGIIKCYINILIRTIIGPLEIALGAIPNLKMGFNTWFINIFANLMVFPISLIILVLIKELMTSVAASDNMWAPPGLGFLDGGNIISMVLGLGGLMLIAKLPKLIPEFIFQIKPSPLGKAIGEHAGGTLIQSAKQGALGSVGQGLSSVAKTRWSQRKGKMAKPAEKEAPASKAKKPSTPAPAG
jgi:hypothetical protein